MKKAFFFFILCALLGGAFLFHHSNTEKGRSSFTIVDEDLPQGDKIKSKFIPNTKTEMKSQLPKELRPFDDLDNFEVSLESLLKGKREELKKTALARIDKKIICLEDGSCLEEADAENPYYDEGNTYQHQLVARYLEVFFATGGYLETERFERLLGLKSSTINQVFLGYLKDYSLESLRAIYESSNEDFKAKFLYLSHLSELKTSSLLDSALEEGSPHLVLSFFENFKSGELDPSFFQEKKESICRFFREEIADHLKKQARYYLNRAMNTKINYQDECGV